MYISRLQQRAPIAHRGLYLVPAKKRKVDLGFTPSNLYYKIAAAGAALFLAMTVC